MIVALLFVLSTEVKAKTKVTCTGSGVKLENEFIRRTLSLKENKIVSGAFANKRLKPMLTFDYNSNSSDFVISVLRSHSTYSHDSTLLIHSNDLTLEKAEKQNIKDGKQVVITFKPYVCDGIPWHIQMTIELGNRSPYLYQYLTLEVPDQYAGKARIDYVDMCSISTRGIPAKDKWTHPQMGPVSGGMSGYMVSLGQPVYVNGMYFGCEFPQTDNQIINDTVQIKYYSGKNFRQLAYAGLTDSQGRFHTHRVVVGATRSADNMNVIKNDFFSYIQKIQRPSKFRIQYNSWYDWMLEITADRINSSFKKMEQGFTSHGLRTIDSYVMDDGWNAYADIQDANSTPNKSGFWEFNAKFPNGLADPAEFARSIGSHVGLWLGPRGGYNYPVQWAKYLEKKGVATYNEKAYEIVTGDSVYVKRLEQFFLENQRKYDINYWKLDGFCTAPPQPSLNGRYISGGYKGMYYITEHWERWYRLLKHLYADGDSRGIDVWINLTCFVNPSPWILQYCNSVWMQCVYDQADVKVDGRDVKMEKQLNYRDGCYFDNENQRQYQFPVSSYFHHDPCYGQMMTEPNSANNEEFKMYLYMVAMRASRLWDLLYSYNYMDEGHKWDINTEVLKFAEANQDILANAIIFGGNPKEGKCYGYSDWSSRRSEGFIAVRNPSNQQKTFSFVLDTAIGVPVKAKSFKPTIVEQYLSTNLSSLPETLHYGQRVTITLGPGEVRIWKLGNKKLTNS